MFEQRLGVASRRNECYYFLVPPESHWVARTRLLATRSVFLSAVGRDTENDDVPEEQALRGIPLHKSPPVDVSKGMNFGAEVSGKDLTGVAGILANAGDDNGKSLHGAGIYVGEGLPPVPPKLAKKISAGEYVEMEELLPEMCTREDSEPGAKRRCSRRSFDIFTWLQCFGVYVSIRGSRSPEMIPELMAYMGTIIRAHREYTGSEWLRDDMLFRKHAALRNDTRWSVINPTIYVRCFTAATRNPPRCETCLSVTHETKDCTQQEISEWDIEARLKSMEQTVRNLSPAPTHYHMQFSGEVCRKWNKGECSYPFCRHTHVCSLCGGGTHPAVRCPRRTRSVPESQPTSWGARRNVGRF